MAKRFIVESKYIRYINDDCFEIFGREVKHIQVLRYNINDEININNYICSIQKITRDTIVLKKLRDAEKIGEPNIELTLFIAMLKNEKLDYVIQKCTELGVKNIVPFISKNVIVKLDDKEARKKRVTKLQIIANEACKQCGRTDIVKVNDIISFNELNEKLEEFDFSIFAYEKENKKLKEVINSKLNDKRKKIACIIGPEGGFDTSEKNQLLQLKNVSSVSLGQRILRADTAAISLVNILMYEFDE